MFSHLKLSTIGTLVIRTEFRGLAYCSDRRNGDIIDLQGVFKAFGCEARGEGIEGNVGGVIITTGFCAHHV